MDNGTNAKINDKVGKATAWSMAAEISAKLIVPITNMILARILAPSAFGIIATLTVVTSFAETFSTSGFQKYIIQHDFNTEDELKKSATVAFWTNLSISFFAWLIIAMFCSQFVSLIGSEGYEIPLIVLSLTLPLSALSSTQDALFQRNLEYKILFIRRIIVSLVPFFVTIPLSVIGMGYWAIIIGTLAGNIVKIITMSIATKWKPGFYFDIKLLSEMMSFGIGTLFEAIVMWACTYIDILIISNKLGDFYTGLYKNAQSTVTGVLTIITGGTTSVLFASLARVKDEEREFESIFYSFQRGVAIFVLPIGVGMFFFSDLITKILLGEQWMEASRFIGVWGLCTSLVCVFGTFCREVYRVKAKLQISLIVQLLHLAFVVPVCWFSVDEGFEVLIYTRSLAYLQIVIVHFIFIKKIFRLSPFKMIWGVKEPIICSCIMGGSAYCLLHIYRESFLMQFLYVFMCSMVYFAVLLAFKEYRRMFFNMIKKFSNNLVKKS